MGRCRSCAFSIGWTTCRCHFERVKVFSCPHRGAGLHPPALRTVADRKDGNRPVEARHLFVERLCGSRRLFDQRRILLRHLIDLTDRDVDFLDTVSLQIRRCSDLFDNARDPAYCLLHLRGGATRLLRLL